MKKQASLKIARIILKRNKKGVLVLPDRKTLKEVVIKTVIFVKEVNKPMEQKKS